MTSTHSASAAAAAPLGFAASTVTLRPACTPCGIRVPHPCPEPVAAAEPVAESVAPAAPERRRFIGTASPEAAAEAARSGGWNCCTARPAAVLVYSGGELGLCCESCSYGWAGALLHLPSPEAAPVATVAEPVAAEPVAEAAAPVLAAQCRNCAEWTHGPEGTLMTCCADGNTRMLVGTV